MRQPVQIYFMILSFIINIFNIFKLNFNFCYILVSFSNASVDFFNLSFTSWIIFFCYVLILL